MSKLKKGRKLNMLVPGSRLCAVIGLVWLAGLVCHLLHMEQVAGWLFLAGAVLALALVVLLVIEHVQDERAYKKAKAEDQSRHAGNKELPKHML